MPHSEPGPRLRTLTSMSSTMLTKRRAVDHCRVRSALCRMPWRAVAPLPSSA